MYRRWFEVALFFGLVIAGAGTLSAQQPQQSSAQPSIMTNDQDTQPPAPPAKPKRKQTATSAFEHDPDLDAEDQLAPSQMVQPMPGAVEEPSHGRPLASRPRRYRRYRGTSRGGPNIADCNALCR